MLYSIKFSHRNTCKKFALGIFLLINAIAPASATTSANYAEMGAALATMAVDIAANHYAFNGNTKKANLFKCSTDLLSLTTKGFFFYNNVQAKTFSDIEWSLYARDCQAHTILMTRDVTKLAEHLYTSIATKNNVHHEPLDFEALTAALALENLNETPGFAVDGAQEIVDQADTPEQDSRTLEYARKVILLPALKGLTALAVACTQGYATSYASDQARFTATAAHCFAQLLEEHSNLDKDSTMSNPLLFALCLNAAWIIYEGNEYRIEQNNNQGQTRQGRCGLCNQETVLNILACRDHHAYCAACLNQRIQNQRDDDTTQLHRIRCPHDGCAHIINHNEMAILVHNAPDAMFAFDEAKFKKANPVPYHVAFDPTTKDVFLANTRKGQCVTCRDNDADLVILSGKCKHAFNCRECLQTYLQHEFSDKTADFDMVKCLAPNCKQHLTQHDICCIASPDREQALLDAFNLAKHAHANPVINMNLADEAEQQQIRQGHLQICPNNLCRRRAMDDGSGGCVYMNCTGCHNEFCYRCGEATQGHNHVGGNQGYDYWHCKNVGLRAGNLVHGPADH